MLLGAILGLPAVLILLTTRRVVYIYWMFIYLLALPIWNFVLPVYAFWHFDDFTWGQTRKVDGGDKGHDHNDRQEISPDAIPLRKWEEWERDRRANIVISYRRRNKQPE
jgi:chitin synthase